MYRLQKGERNKQSSESPNAGKHLINPNITSFSRWWHVRYIFLGKQIWPRSRKNGSWWCSEYYPFNGISRTKLECRGQCHEDQCHPNWKTYFRIWWKHLQLSEKINPKIETRQIDTTNKQNITQDTNLWRMYLVWIWLRQHYGPFDYNSKNNQIVPSFAGN